jgi:hypothetical protein
VGAFPDNILASRLRSEITFSDSLPITGDVDIYAIRLRWYGLGTYGKDDYETLPYDVVTKIESDVPLPFVRQYGYFDTLPLDVLPVPSDAGAPGSGNGWSIEAITKWDFTNA